MPLLRDSPQVHAAHRVLARQVCERAAVDLGARDDDIQDVAGNVEDGPVVHFAETELLRVDSLQEQFAAARDGQDVALLERRGLIGIEGLLAAPYPHDEQARVARRLFDLADPFADQDRPGRDHVGAVLDVAAYRGRGDATALHLLLVTAALFFEIDAHDAGREL